jgi:hypothetical protein
VQFHPREVEDDEKQFELAARVGKNKEKQMNEGTEILVKGCGCNCS